MQLLTIPEVAERLRMKPRQVRFHIKGGKFPGAVKVGKPWLVPKVSVDKLIQSKTIHT